MFKKLLAYMCLVCVCLSSFLRGHAAIKAFYYGPPLSVSLIASLSDKQHI